MSKRISNDELTDKLAALLGETDPRKRFVKCEELRGLMRHRKLDPSQIERAREACDIAEESISARDKNASKRKRNRQKKENRSRRPKTVILSAKTHEEKIAESQAKADASATRAYAKCFEDGSVQLMRHRSSVRPSVPVDRQFQARKSDRSGRLICVGKVA